MLKTKQGNISKEVSINLRIMAKTGSMRWTGGEGETK